MTLQQLKYIVAIDRYRSFAKAADALGISQPTLSAMLVKLEDELDVRIFERSNKSVTPTIAGEKIIRQAERTIAEAERINELVSEDKGDVAGDLRLCVVSSIAPYILPKFIRFYTEDYPQVRLSIIELKGDAIQAALEYRRLAADSKEANVRGACYLLAADAYRSISAIPRMNLMLDHAEEEGALDALPGLWMRVQAAEANKDWASAALYAQDLAASAGEDGAYAPDGSSAAGRLSLNRSSMPRPVLADGCSVPPAPGPSAADAAAVLPPKTAPSMELPPRRLAP